MSHYPATPVIYFDGVCGLCNRFVDVVLRHDKRKIFRFAPIQGITSRVQFGELPARSEEWSIIFVDERGTHERSTAVLRILTRLGGLWSLLGVFYILPSPVRDALYRFIARRRYRWFGRKDACRLPSLQERDRFLP